MKRDLEPTSAPAEQPHRSPHGLLRLSECGDTLTIRQLCAVLQISDRTYRHLRQHGAFPIPELTGVPKRFSRQAVERFLAGQRRSA